MFEKLQGLVWQLLHDGPRTLRATELRQAALRESPHATPGELALLKDRARVLRRYNARTAAHGEPWPPPASLDGHFDYPSDGCGAFVPEIKPPSQRRRGHGGWLGQTQAAHARWGGADACTIRVLSVEEWEAASPRCLAALFTRPFLVRAGAESVVNRALSISPFLLRKSLHKTLLLLSSLETNSDRRAGGVCGRQIRTSGAT